MIGVKLLKDDDDDVRMTLAGPGQKHRGDQEQSEPQTSGESGMLVQRQLPDLQQPPVPDQQRQRQQAPDQQGL